MVPDISVVIPMRNEAPNVEALYAELTAALTALGRPYEVVVVDDGSTDETFRLLAALQAKDAHVRVIRFRRNFGQTAAFAAGFKYARGRFIVTSDGDRQNDPADIPAMVKMAEDEDFDIVAGGGKDGKGPVIKPGVPAVVGNPDNSPATRG